ncbi:MAG: DUF3040 domain-containing protein [Pseudonocardia sp.]|uniref:DUF3040 domain-containing protein n=1 Tax=unclassified Pseudonocardia TaxID=2619320 RepID=UPI000869F015|nr:MULTISPECIES: DUF3040 domain-containing protein [unclassified Pseudonocardia]MBN9111975.1 DUF3040 domain-containing protein [Pseudonocardia sp.]ODU24034.1 MAG: hypothetical protein ABS80_13575 [Pseudonocardia sp. SCN 72-51]ODV06093.1 MAG: hypothetical protein ABT15_14910 [Pseudonocardia sp. SCN 73-27]
MMSREDRRRLEAIERHLAAEDPKFVRRLRRRGAAVGRTDRFPSLRAGGAPRMVWVGLVAGLVILVVGIVAATFTLTLTGMVFLVVSLWAGRMISKHPGQHE